MGHGAHLLVPGIRSNAPDPPAARHDCDELAVEGIRVICTPVRAPRANAFAERFVGTIRRECLDRMLIFTRRQLEAILAEYVEHYNCHRPHRSIAQNAPLAASPKPPLTSCPDPLQLRRSDLLGGLIHEYELTA